MLKKFNKMSQILRKIHKMAKKISFHVFRKKICGNPDLNAAGSWATRRRRRRWAAVDAGKRGSGRALGPSAAQPLRWHFRYFCRQCECG